MDYKLENSENIFNGEVLEKISDNEYRIKIQDTEYIIQILSITPNGMEFVINNEFHTVAVQMDFKSPAKLNDKLEIYSSIKKVGNSSLTFYQEIYKEGSDDLLNSAEIVWVHTNQKEMKSAIIPEDLRKKFEKYLIN